MLLIPNLHVGARKYKGVLRVAMSNLQSTVEMMTVVAKELIETSLIKDAPGPEPSLDWLLKLKTEIETTWISCGLQRLVDDARKEYFDLASTLGS